jgi:hypothetical protein
MGPGLNTAEVKVGHATIASQLGDQDAMRRIA